MYCIQCGVRLADSEKQCPLCGTAVFHPQLSRPEGERLYPAESRPAPQVSPWGVLTVLSVLFTLPLFITLLCDFQLHGQITWFGYVAGGVTVAYVSFVQPFWFRRPNPVIFIPAAAAAAGGQCGAGTGESGFSGHYGGFLRRAGLPVGSRERGRPAGRYRAFGQ